MTRHRPIIWVTDEPCIACGLPGQMENPLYGICPKCWCAANGKDIAEIIVKHVKEREKS